MGWAAGYDAAVGSVLAAAAEAGEGALVLAGLLEQSGFNYDRVEKDRLRAAAAGWQDGADLLIDAAFAVTDAVASIAQQVGPEVDAVSALSFGVAQAPTQAEQADLVAELLSTPHERNKIQPDAADLVARGSPGPRKRNKIGKPRPTAGAAGRPRP